jgi:hypothetical protein
MTASILAPITGAELNYQFHSEGLRARLFPTLVAEGPTQALVRIAERFECSKHLQGWECQGIVDIREALFAHYNSEETINSTYILAPHTHWSTDRPIIYNYDPIIQQYQIGHHAVSEAECYTPVSFTLAGDTLLPYEWADSSIKIDCSKHNAMCAVFSDLHNRFNDRKYPLGIGIDFRFKDSLKQKNLATVETELEQHSDDFCRIMQLDDYLAEGLTLKNVEQVAWSAAVDPIHKLDPQQRVALSHIRQMLSEKSSVNERRNLIKAIEAI